MNQPFRTTLTIMPDYGFGPFLWRTEHADERGVGPNICDASHWDPTMPLSEPLWLLFAIWVGSFELAGISPDEFERNGWDWSAFHDRGRYLAYRLKQEVGHEYRVVYEKPCEDPDHLVDERQEILLDGGRKALPPHHILCPHSGLTGNQSPTTR